MNAFGFGGNKNDLMTEVNAGGITRDADATRFALSNGVDTALRTGDLMNNNINGWIARIR